jgi:4-amino-4-deoxy-L-arabinose transferase-like glycosyltransferase
MKRASAQVSYLRAVFSDRSSRLLIIILIAYLFCSFFMVTKFPRVWIDTSWTVIPAYTLAREGELSNPTLRGGGGSAQHILAPGVSQAVLLATTYKIFGFGLVQSRALSIFAGFFLILSTFYFAKRYYDDTIALLAIIIMASDNVFFVTSRTVRPDILLALFSASGFFLFLHALETKSLKSFTFSGMLVGVSLYTHPNSFLVLVAITVILFWRFGFSMFKSKLFWTFSLFCLIAFTPYAWYVIKEDYGNGLSHFMAQLGGRAGFLNGRYWETYLFEYTRYVNYIYFPRRIIIFVIQIAALIFAAFSKRRMDRYLLVLVLVFIALLPEWNQGNRTPRYFIVFIPALSILVSRLFKDFFQKVSFAMPNGLVSRRRAGYAVAGLIMALFFLNQIGGNIFILWKHKDNDFYSFIAKVRTTIPEGSKIWGSTAFWIGLHNYPYLTQSSPYKEVERFRPDYAILYDSSIWGEKSATLGRDDPTADTYTDIREKMELLCLRKGTFLKKIRNKFYGDVEIYKINWDRIPDEG